VQSRQVVALGARSLRHLSGERAGPVPAPKPDVSTDVAEGADETPPRVAHACGVFLLQRWVRRHPPPTHIAAGMVAVKLAPVRQGRAENRDYSESTEDRTPTRVATAPSEQCANER
jgi:hypothetical protein